jgi:hypothetical protein
LKKIEKLQMKNWKKNLKNRKQSKKLLKRKAHTRPSGLTRSHINLAGLARVLSVGCRNSGGGGDSRGGLEMVRGMMGSSSVCSFYVIHVY